MSPAARRYRYAKGIVRLIFRLFLAAPIAFVSHAYWDGFIQTSLHGEYEIQVGQFGFGDNPLDKLPEGIPQHITDRLKELADSEPPEKIEALVDAVSRYVAEYPPFQNEDSSVVIAADMEGLFSEGMPALKGGDFIIYLSEENGAPEISVVHISAGSSVTVTSAEELLNALNQPWSGVNQIANVWLRGNLYDTFNAPLEYGGKLYLMNYDGPSGIRPADDPGTWFEIPGNYVFSDVNRSYYRGYIVRHDYEYFIARESAFGNIPSLTGWSPWSVISLWQPNTSYAAGAVVRTQDRGARFWRCLAAAANIRPTETSASDGIWQEISNGWIGRSGDNFIKSYYFNHNIYSAGTTVIYGVSPKMKYRYFTSIKDVPANEPPLKEEEEGFFRLNEEFWKVYE